MAFCGRQSIENLNKIVNNIQNHKMSKYLDMFWAIYVCSEINEKKKPKNDDHELHPKINYI